MWFLDEEKRDTLAESAIHGDWAKEKCNSALKLCLQSWEALPVDEEENKINKPIKVVRKPVHK